MLKKTRIIGGVFGIYDPLYPSTPNDPGAYISYSAKDAPEHFWYMTMGNHGWSGGKYLVPEGIVVNQILNLFNKGLLEEIKKGTPFGSHYEMKSEKDNQQLISKLTSIHLSLIHI